MAYISKETWEWSYSAVRQKVSHNSYARDERPITEQLDWAKGKKYDRGCRGLELDLHQSSEHWLWSVRHIGGYENFVDKQLSI